LNNRKQLVTELATVAGFCAFLQFFGLASVGLTGADEPRYAEIAREMLARHDWVTPVLYGHPWFEKPPLYYWSTMLAYKFVGVNDWAARLSAAKFATLTVFAIYFFLRKFRPGNELDGALMTACSVAFIGFARAAGPDMLLTACVTIALLAWMTWAQGGERRWLLVYYLFAALGMLAKGPVSPFLCGIIIAVYAAVRREWRLILKTLWLPGIGLFLAVAMPWYVLVQIRNPEFFRIFIVEHNVERFSSNLYQHHQPFWYYVPVMLIAVLPWTFYSLAAVVEGVRMWRGRAARATAGESPALQVEQFLVVWFFVVLIFFSIAQSKLPGYVLPALPACTVLTALYVQRGLGTTTRRGAPFGLLVGHAAVLALLTAGVLIAPYAVAHAAGAPRVTSGVLAGGVFLAVAWTVYGRGLRMLRFVTLAPMIVLLAFVLRVAAPGIDARTSYREAAAALDAIDGRKTPVALYKARREALYGMAYYRGQTILSYVPTYFDQPQGIPAGDHMVIAPEGSEEAIALMVGGRRVSRVGGYAPQKLAFYWVSPAMRMK
jgi:4-amino-4-deoxy-L-arabinose transferase-like glycosyltransferase